MMVERLTRRISRNRLWLRIRTRVSRDPHKRVLSLWLLDQPHEEARYAYPLTDQSVVLDVGGYRGEWAAEIARRYDPYVHIFEPVPVFAAALVKQFANNHKVRVYDFGLSDTDGRQLMAVVGDASSAYLSSTHPIEVVSRDIARFLAEANIESVDLVKINIEGGEYPLLRRMIESGILTLFRDIQVQFHDFVPDAQRQYLHIRTELARTHVLTYEYPFVWENWRLDPAAVSELLL
jgi:FkbM family methyltransferase